MSAAPSPSRLARARDRVMHRQAGPRSVARLLTIRRRVAGAVLLVGALNLLSAFTPPLRDRAELLDRFLPVAATQTATVATATLSAILILVAAGLRRGLRRAWTLALVAAGLNALSHLLKGIDVEEGVLTAAFTLVLLHWRAAFTVRARLPHVAGPRAVGSLGVLSLTAGALWRWEAHGVVSVVLAGIGVAALVAALWWYLRPPHAPAEDSATAVLGERDELETAQSCVADSADPLAYFALRADKDRCWARASDGVGFVAYRVVDGACLVSPDPQGPPDAARRAWQRLQSRACAHGWPLVVLGASATWLARYRQDGMTCLYLGDVAIVDLDEFDLSAASRKSIRQAHRRVTKRGYRTEVHRVAELSAAASSEARALAEGMVAGRERGFSMALGRLAAPEDPDALVACTYGPDGRMVGVLQFLPAGPGRYSLDVMRAERDGHPNGLTDFALVELITWARDHGLHELALNFAVRRGVVDGERGTDLERRLLGWVSERSQVHSLWHFNAKYSPRWEPRWVCVDGGFTATVLRSVVNAEQLWEIPVLGWFLPDPD